jgi:hypothetical protein
MPNDYIVKNIFIFTDMQFNAASNCECSDNEKTLFETIKKKYTKALYTMPKLIFWNLRHSEDAFPITCNENGYIYLSGFSAELLKIFMNGIEFNPLTILEALLDKYNVLISDNDKNYIFE